MEQCNSKIKKYLNVYINILLTLILTGTCIIGMLQPIMADDYFFIARIRSQGFISFLKTFYLTWSGRIANSFFMALTSINSFYFVLSGLIIGIVFILLVFFIVTCALGRFPKIYSKDRMVFIIAFAFMWFGVPTLGECVFWRSGAGSYLVPMFLGILFITPYVLWYHSKKNINNKLFNILMLLMGIAAGSTQEQVFALLFSFSLIWFVFVRRNRIKIPNYLYFGLAGLLLGGAILILAPGNYIRFASAEHRSLFYVIAALGAYFGIYYFIVPLQQLWIWILVILLIIVILNFHKNKEEKLQNYNIKILNKRFYFWLVIALSAVIPMIALPGSVAARTCFSFITFLTTAFISLFYEYKDNMLRFSESKIGTIILVVVLNIILVDICIGAANGYLLSKEVKSRDNVILQNKAKGINEMEVAPFDIMNFHTTYIYDVKIDKEHATNKAVSLYYNIKSIKLNHALGKYRVEEDLDVVDGIKNRIKEKLQ